MSSPLLFIIIIHFYSFYSRLLLPFLQTFCSLYKLKVILVMCFDYFELKTFLVFLILFFGMNLFYLRKVVIRLPIQVVIVHYHFIEVILILIFLLKEVNSLEYFSFVKFRLVLHNQFLSFFIKF